MRRSRQQSRLREPEIVENTAPATTPAESLADWGVTEDEAQQLLRRQLCPVCGEGPWQSPLNHVSKKHGIDRHTMRDMCGLTTTESVLGESLRERFSEREITSDQARAMVESRQALGRDRRWTRAGAASVGNNLATWADGNPAAAVASQRAASVASKTPRARAEQGASLHERWAGLSDAERELRTAHLRRSSEALSEQAAKSWDSRGRKPCGTRAAYRRGCRCDACRAANTASKK